MPSSSPNLLWVFRRDRTQWLREWDKGERSSEFFYGYTDLRKRYQASFIEDEGFNPLWYPWYPLEWLLARALRAGFALHLALWNLPALRRADVIVSTGDSVGLPIAFLKGLGWIKGRLLYITHGQSDHVRRFGEHRLLSRFYRGLLRDHVESLIALSEGARQGLAEWLGIPEARIHTLPFGVDTDFWQDTSLGKASDEMVSVGSDAGRDYATLLASAQGLPLHIVTRQNLALKGYPNARRTTEHSGTELRDIYSRARFVVLPLEDRDQPSGQSAGLQAMSCGKAVIVTRTRGWWGEAFLKNGQNCITVPPGDISALRQAIESLWYNPDTCKELGAAARRTVLEAFTNKRMDAAITEIILEQLQCRP